MKKLIALLLALVMVVGLVACGAKEETAAPVATDAAPAATEAAKEEAAPAAPESAEAVEDVLKLPWRYLNKTKTAFYGPANKGNHLDGHLIWNTLIRMDPETGEIVYELAESMDVSPDGLTYTFKLADAYWHDGTPVTAADVVYTYNFQVFGPWPTYAAKLSNIKGYEEAAAGTADSISGIYAVDDKTVVFELVTPNYLLLSMTLNNIFANSYFAIMPYHILGNVAWEDIEAHEYWTKPIGTGSYMVEEVSYPNYAVLTRYENYHKNLAGIEKVTLTSFTDEEAQIATAMAGDLHSMRNVNKEAVLNAAAQNPDIGYFEHSGASFRAIGFMIADGVTKYPDLQKKEVRQAINLIIDKQMIADYLGSASPATTFNADLEYNTDIPAWTRDVETGVQMLKDAGFNFSQTLPILAYYSDQATVDVLDIIVANLAEAGITAEYTIDEETSNESWATGEYALYYYGGGSNTPVYAEWINDGQRESWMNGYDSERRAQYADLWNKYQSTADAAGRKAIAAQMQALYIEDMYAAPLYFMNNGYLINSGKIQGWTGVSQDYESVAYYDTSAWSVIK